MLVREVILDTKIRSFYSPYSEELKIKKLNVTKKQHETLNWLFEERWLDNEMFMTIFAKKKFDVDCNIISDYKEKNNKVNIKLITCAFIFKPEKNLGRFIRYLNYGKPTIFINIISIDEVFNILKDFNNFVVLSILVDQYYIMYGKVLLVCMSLNNLASERITNFRFFNMPQLMRELSVATLMYIKLWSILDDLLKKYDRTTVKELFFEDEEVKNFFSDKSYEEE